MAVTGVYFIPSNPNSATALAQVTERLRATYDPVPIGRWGLEHKLMRDTHSCLPASTYAPLPPLQPRFMQFLSMAHYPSHGFIYTSDRPDPDPWAEGASSKPGASAGHHAHQPPPSSTQSSSSPTPAAGSGNQSQSHLHPPHPLPMKMMTPDPTSFISWFHITLRACEPLWSHRHTVAVQTGVVYEVADFRVRIGDVRQTYPVTRIRGTAVEIEYCGPATYNNTDNAIDNPDDPTAAEDPFGRKNGEMAPSVSIVDWEIGEILIREFWERLGLTGAREAIRVPDVGKEIREAGEEKGRNPGKKMRRKGQSELAGVDLARQYMKVFRFNR